jgi:hypothetical protein
MVQLNEKRDEKLMICAVRIYKAKKKLALLDQQLTDARTHAQSLGVKNIHEFEESLEIWE